MNIQNKSICFFTILLVLLPSLCTAEWYTSKILDISTRSDTNSEILYIKTELSPNPNNCRSNWNGAQWENTTGQDLAATIAISAKVSDREIKFYIKDDECGLPSGNPVMEWIQIK